MAAPAQTCIDCYYQNCQCNFPLVASGNNVEGRKLYFVRENESEDSSDLQLEQREGEKEGVGNVGF